MKTKIATLLKLISLVFLSGIGLIANAQKLPNVQPTGMRAPANIKVDGKTTEWDDTFQAYNHATDIYYTLANDDDKLYLVVQARDRQIINKIIGGGVTLIIQKSGKKTDKGGISITYPLFDAKDRPYVRGGGGGMKTISFSVSGGGGEMARPDNIQSIAITDGKTGNGEKAAQAALEGDSIMNVYNKRLDDKSKNIAVTGIPGLDTLISVYNQDGIRTAERFNNKLVYTYELGIDLKKLGLSANDASKFAYHISLNGASMGMDNVKIDIAGGSASPAAQEQMQQMLARINANNGSQATDFWGEYTLAKK